MLRRAVLFVSLLVFGSALGMAFTGAWPWTRLQEASPIIVTRAYRIGADTLRSGETLGALFNRQGVASFDLVGLARTVGLDPRRLKAGLVFNFRKATDETEPSEVTVRTGLGERLRFSRQLDSWGAVREPIRWTREVVRLDGQIRTSLYDALDESVPDELLDRGERIRLAWDLADVYAWSLDFTRDIQPGDDFAVLVEREVSEEGEIRFGRVLAAALGNGGKQLTAFRFEEEGKEKFYDAMGNSLKGAFLQAPVQFRRISSNFSRTRFHPILRRVRPHTGTDYSAASGTPVMAAGDGTVARAGWLSGYGIVVEIRHRNGILTRYAHLRGTAKGIRSGARVSQSEIIGYVGSTGLSTSAHLHYEFLVNGVPRDARRMRNDGGTPVPSPLRPAFELERDRLSRLLAAGSRPASLTRRGD